MTGFVPSAGAKPIWFSEGDPDVGQSSVAVPLLEAVIASRRGHCVSLLEGPALSSAVVVTVSWIPAIALVARKSEATIASGPAISNLILIERLSLRLRARSPLPG